MKSINTVLMLIFGLIFCGTTLSHAQTVYVVDEFEITMRSGPSIENKIIAMLPTATKLHMIEEKGDWLFVQSPTGSEGWVLKRFTSVDTPKKIMIERLQIKYRDASKNLEIETKNASAFENENQKLRIDLNNSQKQLKRVKQDYASLIDESKDFLKLKKENTQNLANLKKATLELGQIRKEYNELRSSTNIIWFLSGAAVVIISWLIGYVMGRIKKRSHSLYG